MVRRSKCGRNDPCTCGSTNKFKKCCAEKINAEWVGANFLEDLRIAIIEEMKHRGFSIRKKKQNSIDEVSRIYFNLLKRLPKAKPRQVHRSRELTDKILTDALATVLNTIADFSQRGNSLQPFLHRLLEHSDFNDRLLNDWGVLHFHLGGVTPESDGYVSRSNDLLFAFVTDTDFYMLDIMSHPPLDRLPPASTSTSWAAHELIEVLHRNWPAVIARYRVPDEGMGHLLSDAERADMRAGGVVACTKLADGTVYFPPGGGYMTTGLSKNVLVESDKLLDYMQTLERDMRSRAEDYIDVIVNSTGKSFNRLNYRLRATRSVVGTAAIFVPTELSGFSVIETQSGIELFVGP